MFFMCYVMFGIEILSRLSMFFVKVSLCWWLGGGGYYGFLNNFFAIFSFFLSNLYNHRAV